MTTRPISISLDTAAVAGIRDLAPARASDLPRDQHALMSAWGGPEQARACYYTALAGVTTTYYPSVRVPPGVTEMGVEVLMSGTGRVLITSPADATGSLLLSAVTYDDTSSLENASRLYAGTVSDYSSPGRALTVRSAVAWTWETVQLEMIINPNGFDVVIYGLSFVPIHIPR